MACMQKESPSNTAAERRMVRQYSDWHGVDNKYLVPAGRVAGKHDQDCLVHVELPDESCCLGMKVTSEDKCLLFRKGKVFHCTWPALVQLLTSFVGCKETAVFKLSDADPSLDRMDMINNSWIFLLERLGTQQAEKDQLLLWVSKRSKARATKER